ncbi:hypothetical protein K1X84_11450 [bacterium]|nr:hypothetical protein [bacterium]
MYKYILLILFFIFLSCSKKQPDIETDVKPLELDLPLLHERNLDSVKLLSYEDRLLAFSIDLGQRSTDFNRRLGLTISANTPDKSWINVIETVWERDNYTKAKSANLNYLQNFRSVIDSPEKKFRPYYDDLIQSHNRLINNYEIISKYREFANMSAILDSVLTNELAINASLRQFENFMREKKKLK